MPMNPHTATAGTPAVPVTSLQPVLDTAKIGPADFRLPPRGACGPVAVGELLQPLRRIVRHPERNRLLAEFLKDE